MWPSNLTVNITAFKDCYRKDMANGVHKHWVIADGRFEKQILSLFLGWWQIVGTLMHFPWPRVSSWWFSTNVRDWSWSLSVLPNYSYCHKSESITLSPFRHQSDLYYLNWKRAPRLVPDWHSGKTILFLNSQLNMWYIKEPHLYIYIHYY
jgi:hypothetical protein